MDLTSEDYILGHKIASTTITLDSSEIDFYIQNSIKNFTDKLNMSNLEDRRKAYSFLRHISTLLMNYDLNGGIYLLGEKEINKAHLGAKTIIKIIEEFRAKGL